MTQTPTTTKQKSTSETKQARVATPQSGGLEMNVAPPTQHLHEVQRYSPSQMLWLQRAVGNRTVQRMVQPQSTRFTVGNQVVQAKLNVGPVNDRYEQEADRVAKQVVSMGGAKNNGPIQRHHDEDEVQLKPIATIAKTITPLARHQPIVRRHPGHAEEEGVVQGKWIQRHPSHAEEEDIVQGKRVVQRHPSHAEEEDIVQGKRIVQRQPQTIGTEGGSLDQETERSIRNTQGGQPLEKNVRGSMEKSFGADFSGVRVHNNGKADSLNRSLQAKAFTTGQNIFFRHGQYNPGSQGGKQLLAHELTHVVQQNSGVVQTKPAVDKTTTKKAKEESAQRKTITKDGRGVIRRNFFKKLFGIGKKKREAKLSEKHGVPIGSSGPNAGSKAHFSHGMMDKIDKVLSGLPEEHVRGNDKLKTIGSITPTEKQEALEDGSDPGAASTYDFGTGKISMNKPMSWMPWWLYTMLSPKHKWQLKLMDKGAMEGYSGVSKEKDKQLGIKHSDRSVFAGVSDVMVRKGGLATQTLRHEMGHAVDDKIKFTRTRAYMPLFGGWRHYRDEERIEKLGKRLMKKFGATNAILDLTRGSYRASKDFYHELIANGDVNWDPTEKAQGYANTYGALNKGTPEEEKRQLTQSMVAPLTKFKDFLTWMRVQPWTLPDGGAAHLEVDGRVYQKDHYGKIGSYLADKRKHAVSNYQFSSPGEWFAEAYTAYYDPDPTFEGREMLEPGVRSWFEKNLGHHIKAQRVQSSLVNDQGKLTELRPHEAKFGLSGEVEGEEDDVLNQKDGELMEGLMEMNEFREFDMDIAK